MVDLNHNPLEINSRREEEENKAENNVNATKKEDKDDNPRIYGKVHSTLLLLAT